MLFKKAFWMIKGKLMQSFLHILLMVIVASSLYIGILFKEAAEFVRSGGTFYYPISVISKDSGKSIPVNTIHTLAESPLIAGYNSFFSYMAKPVDFKNYVEGTKSQQEKDSMIELSANLNIRFADIFANNTAKLIEGGFPTADNHGVIIEKSMAEHNRINIGDTVKIELNENNMSKSLSMKVLGIYELKVPLEVEDSSHGQTVYVVSPNTRLYTNYETVAESGITIKNAGIVCFYTFKEKNVSSILEDFKNKTGPELDVQNATDLPLALLNLSVDKVNQYLDWIIYALLLTSLIMLILFSVYTQHRNTYGLAILTILGGSKKQIIIQNSIQVFILAAIANSITSLAAFFCSRFAGLFWISKATEGYQDSLISYSFHTEKAALINNYNVNDLGVKILVVSLIIFLISLLVSILYSVFFLKLTPKKMTDTIN